MTRNERIPAIGLAVVAAAALLGAAAVVLIADDGRDVDPSSTPIPSLSLAPGEVQGVCTVTLPPNPDPCDAANGTLRYGALGALVNVPYLRLWRNANPGEVARLNAKMSGPVCSVPATPQPQIMRTHFGAFLGAIAEAIACVRHPEPITWPAANPPPDPSSSDKTPPSAPGPLTVTPGG